MPEEKTPSPDESGEVEPHGPRVNDRRRRQDPEYNGPYRRQDDRPPEVRGRVSEMIVSGGWAAKVVGAVLGGENGQRVMIFVLSLAALGVIGWMSWLSRTDHQNTMGMVIRSAEDMHDKERRGCDETESKLRTFFAEENAKSRIAHKEQVGEVYRFYATEREKDRLSMQSRDDQWRGFITSLFSKKTPNEEFPCPLPAFAEPVTAPMPRAKVRPYD